MGKIFILLMCVMFVGILFIPTNYVPESEVTGEELYTDYTLFRRTYEPDCGKEIEVRDEFTYNSQTKETIKSEVITGGCKL